MFPVFKADIKRYIKSSGWKEKIYLFFEQGIWAIAVYRFGRWVRRVRIPIISHILKLIAFILFKIMEIVTGVSLPVSAQIGKGLYVGHFGTIILHSNVKMGKNCSIGPGVIIGTKGQGNQGTPVIGNDVYFGTGSKILGPVLIGDHVKVGANTVVIKDVPVGATVVGVPARIIQPASGESRS